MTPGRIEATETITAKLPGSIDSATKHPGSAARGRDNPRISRVLGIFIAFAISPEKQNKFRSVRQSFSSREDLNCRVAPKRRCFAI
jgi:hypothetical protein